MAITRTISTTPTIPSVTPTFSDSAQATTGAVAFEMSADRTTLYGAGGTNGTILRQSTDDGVTWTTIHDFSTLRTVQQLFAAGDGEMIVTTGSSAKIGEVFKSTGWASNPATATWTTVKTAVTVGNYFDGRWRGFAVAPGALFIAEYGGKSGSTDPAVATLGSIRVYRSTDYGVTWGEVFNLLNVMPPSTNLHVHSVHYDQWWDRIWVTFGDDGGPNGNVSIGYSDNWRDTVPTWSYVPTPVTGLTATVWQCTSILAMEDSILFGSDGFPSGVWRIGRAGFRSMTPLHYASLTAQGTGSIHIGFGFYRAAFAGAPALLSLGKTTSANPSTTKLVSTRDGTTFKEVFSDSLATASTFVGLTAMVGPTASGKIVGYSSGDGRYSNPSKIVIDTLDL